MNVTAQTCTFSSNKILLYQFTSNEREDCIQSLLFQRQLEICDIAETGNKSSRGINIVFIHGKVQYYEYCENSILQISQYCSKPQNHLISFVIDHTIPKLADYIETETNQVPPLILCRALLKLTLLFEKHVQTNIGHINVT